MPANTLLKRFLNKLRFVSIFFLVFGTIFLTLYFFNSYFQVKNIKVIGKKSNLLGLEEISGKNLLFISESKIKEIISKKNPSIKSLSFQKHYPSSLVLEINFLDPIAKLVVEGGFYNLAENGKIVSKSRQENSNLTKINFYQKFNYQSYRQGDNIVFKEILAGLYFLQSLIDLNIKVDSLDINGINMLLFNLENKKIIFSSEKEKELQVFQMKEIIRRFKIEGKQYKEIDLRYDKPIIRF